MSVETMVGACKKLYGIKLGTDLTLNQVEIIENEFFHNWQNGGFDIYLEEKLGGKI